MQQTGGMRRRAPPPPTHTHPPTHHHHHHPTHTHHPPTHPPTHPLPTHPPPTRRAELGWEGGTQGGVNEHRLAFVDGGPLVHQPARGWRKVWVRPVSGCTPAESREIGGAGSLCPRYWNAEPDVQGACGMQHCSTPTASGTCCSAGRHAPTPSCQLVEVATRSPALKHVCVSGQQHSLQQQGGERAGRGNTQAAGPRCVAGRQRTPQCRKQGRASGGHGRELAGTRLPYAA